MLEFLERGLRESQGSRSLTGHAVVPLQVNRWSNGRAVFASGTQFPPITLLDGPGKVIKIRSSSSS